MKKRNINIFDTTLRDGAQATEQNVGIFERKAIGEGLIELGVNVIEAGFASASKVDFETIKYLAKKSSDTNTHIASLSRAVEFEIDKSWEALKFAKNPIIHTFISTSNIHMKEKLNMSRTQVYKSAVNSVRYAKQIMNGKGKVEFSLEDATRTDKEFIAKVVEGVIDAGADIINLPDTVGYAQRGEIKDMIEYLKFKVPKINTVQISVHCHNDLGQATANSLEGILFGANQVECTINGVGERAGNSAMEEIVASIVTRLDIYGDFTTSIDTRKFGSLSKIVSEFFNMKVQPNKAIVGNHAFKHMSGIHQDGVIKNNTTYEIMTPEDFGWSENDRFEITQSSGRAGYRKVLSNLGFNLTDDELIKIYTMGQEHITKYNSIDERILACMLTDKIRKPKIHYTLENFQIVTGSNLIPTANVTLSNGNKTSRSVQNIEGPISSLYHAIDDAVGCELEIDDFIIRSLGKGKSAVGETILTVKNKDRIVYGWGLDNDIVTSAAKAYMSALNKL